MNAIVRDQVAHSPVEGRRSSVAARLPWTVMLVASVGILLYGLLAAVKPSMMATGYESYTTQTWDQLKAQSPDTAAYMLWIYRLVGGLNAALGITLIALTLGPARRGERWAWWILLAGAVLGYGAPMIYDQAVGYIGLFEILEFIVVGAVVVAFLVAILRKD